MPTFALLCLYIDWYARFSFAPYKNQPTNGEWKKNTQTKREEKRNYLHLLLTSWDILHRSIRQNVCM